MDAIIDFIGTAIILIVNLFVIGGGFATVIWGIIHMKDC